MFLDPEEFSVDEFSVGYILRGKPQRHKVKKENPLDNPRHADCILPGGHVAGYAYDLHDDESPKDARKEKGLEGKVAFDKEMQVNYWDIKRAEEYNVLSSFLLFRIDSWKARTFKDYWNRFQREKNISGGEIPVYHKLTNNCSTLCYDAFKHATILESERVIIDTDFNHLEQADCWFRVMTPKTLYNMLLKKYSKLTDAKLVTGTGYLGLVPDEQRPNSYKIILKKKSIVNNLIV